MEAVGKLAGGVAHDFNNLLTVIRGNGEIMMGDRTMSPGTSSDLKEILDATDRASALTRQLLAFSRKQIVQPRVVDLNELIRGLEKMLRRLIGEDIGIQLRLTETKCWVLVDPGQIEQVLVNLAVNARDAMPSGGTLTIATSLLAIDNEPQAPVRSETGSSVVLSVIDTGTGIDAVTQARIFEPFFTTKGAGKGTGLGLSTVYGIVQQSGGQIICRSELGRGTEFRVYLPMSLEAASPAAIAEQGRGIVRGNETILLVEDDDAVRVLTRRLLTKHGYTVLTADSGPDALHLSDDYAGAVHLLMTDMVMPEMSGIEVAREIQSRRPDVRVLLMSGYTDDEILRRGIHEPNLAFLQKPFTAEELGRAVRDVLDGDDPGTVTSIEKARPRSA
jgi:CheY-like chemotaxis protein